MYSLYWFIWFHVRWNISKIEGDLGGPLWPWKWYINCQGSSLVLSSCLHISTYTVYHYCLQKPFGKTSALWDPLSQRLPQKNSSFSIFAFSVSKHLDYHLVKPSWKFLQFLFLDSTMQFQLLNRGRVVWHWWTTTSVSLCPWGYAQDVPTISPVVLSIGVEKGG